MTVSRVKLYRPLEDRVMPRFPHMCPIVTYTVNFATSKDRH